MPIERSWTVREPAVNLQVVSVPVDTPEGTEFSVMRVTPLMKCPHCPTTGLGANALERHIERRHS